jgi:asparagine synthase (glutamine-hydrolysing)
VLLAAYRAWGAACLTRLAGMFAFAVWDRDARTLFLARDRAGEKPLYWTMHAGAFVFASEVKALLRWPGLPRRLDHVALAEFLHFGFVADPRSVWEGVHKLAPGHSLTVRLGDGGARPGEPAQWWDMTFEPDHAVRDWSPIIRDTFARVVDEMAVADVPLGTFLSGGVDSSAVTAALARARHSVTAFTIGFRDDPDDERPWAREVAARYGVLHKERELCAEDLGPVYDPLLWHYDEPFNDTSFLPTFCVCREARGELTVALSGDGGDELFAGYRRYHYLATRAFRYGWVSPAMARGARSLAGLVLPRRHQALRRLDRFAADRATLLTGMLTIGHTRETLAGAARGELAAALRDYDPRETVERHLAALPPDTGLVDAMRYLDLKLTLAGGMLVKVDRASMAVALEVRAVFLHPDMLALAGRIPAERLVWKGQPKHALKEALREWLPAPLLFRRKRGFSAPLGRWMRTGEHAEEEASSGHRIDELLDPALLASLRTRHAAGDGDLSRTIHSLVLLDRWLDRWAA